MSIIIAYDKISGQIMASMPGDPRVIPDQLKEQGFAFLEVEDPIDIKSNRVEDGKFIAMERQPNPLYVIQDGKWVMPKETVKAFAKKDRSALLSETDWISTRHRDQLDLGTQTSLTDTQYIELLDYKQALRDWPASGDYNESFPARPEWL
jgi:hypothetical protein